ncbi:serine hydrolase domain-containing protein [Paenibacillus ginsengarvi]|uniref:Class C beta-lactamase-related serine hydrolase n=1 Tax=Paenibacillus ginsengarvi TaxID=400777 RepID=A0A3B0AWM4_9BACL|nr:serine hydrolase [Paenibacillus ginsengarvi]RKN64584.1 class C beta-lactamase-related serine hydrolase [Paenibacillus ginsengarvi]
MTGSFLTLPRNPPFGIGCDAEIFSVPDSGAGRIQPEGRWGNIKINKKILTILCMIIMVLGYSIYHFNARSDPASKAVKNDYFPESEWRTSKPEEQGMDSEQLLRMIEYLKDQKSKIRSIVIIRNGYMVLNANFYPYREDLVHTLQSTSKSVLSALIGIAVKEGKITDIQNKVLPYFPDKSIDNMDPLKQEITIQNLLTMTAGFDWRESTVPYGQTGNSYTEATQAADPVLFALNRPMQEKPGSIFNYNTGATDILSAMEIKSFLKNGLWNPRGLT